MSSIRGRASGLDNAGGLRSAPDDLSAYADYFSESFAANSVRRDTVTPYELCQRGIGSPGYPYHDY